MPWTLGKENTRGVWARACGGHVAAVVHLSAGLGHTRPVKPDRGGGVGRDRKSSRHGIGASLRKAGLAACLRQPPRRAGCRNISVFTPGPGEAHGVSRAARRRRHNATERRQTAALDALQFTRELQMEFACVLYAPRLPIQIHTEGFQRVYGGQGRNIGVYLLQVWCSINWLWFSDGICFNTKVSDVPRSGYNTELTWAK